MKEKLKNNKGITLVALVITIIILLILAMVSISLVMNTRIINHANNAVTSYKEAEENEQKQLNAIADEIGKYTEKTDTEWWKLTEKEATEIEDIGSGSYLIASNGINGSQEGGRVAIINLNNVIFIEIGKISEGYAFFLSETGKETALGSLSDPGLDLYKWYKLNNDNTLTEYTGTSPIQKNEFTTIKSETYLDRMINSFGK